MTRRIVFRGVSAIVGVVLVTACGQGSPTWTLYRTTIIGTERLHMATFDADDAGGGTRRFNEVNCHAAAELFQDAAHKLAPDGKSPIRYWCEEGEYRS